jgi:hypothetical protein
MERWWVGRLGPIAVGHGRRAAVADVACVAGPEAGSAAAAAAGGSWSEGTGVEFPSEAYPYEGASAAAVAAVVVVAEAVEAVADFVAGLVQGTLPATGSHQPAWGLLGQRPWMVRTEVHAQTDRPWLRLPFAGTARCSGQSLGARDPVSSPRWTQQLSESPPQGSWLP